jgi:hypothetical protein
MSTLRVADGVGWSVGRASLILTDGKGHVRTLRYPEAAVWDLFCRGYAFDKVVALTKHIAGLEPAGAEQLVRTCIETWCAAELLV